MSAGSAWTEQDGALERTFVFADFKEAFAFMVRVAEVAERQGHHPDWRNSYNTVTIRLRTHDAGGAITDKDHRLATTIDRLHQ